MASVGASATTSTYSVGWYVGSGVGWYIGRGVGCDVGNGVG